MEHEDLQSDIPALLASRLDDEARLRLERHLETCESCAGVVAAARPLLSALGEVGDALWDEHPSVEQIRSFATGASSVGGGPFAAHLAICPSCALEIDAWKQRRSPEKASALPSAVSRPSPAPIPFLLAGLAAGVLVGVALAALLTNRGVWIQPSGARGPRGVAPYGEGSGPVRSVRLELPSRGEGRATAVQISSEDPFVLLRVPAEFPHSGGAGAKFTIEIVDSSGRIAWRTDLTGDELAAKIESETSLLPLLVPTVSLPDGACELFVRAAPDGSGPLLRIPFEVSRYSGASSSSPPPPIPMSEGGSR